MPKTSSHFIHPLAFSALDGITGVTFNGIAATDYSGWSVASAGDVNGDGFDDVVIGAWGAAPGGLFRVGSTYLIFGHTGVWSSSLVLGSLNGNNGVIINGVAANDYSGYSVASAGDVNGDGIDDMLIGASQASPGGLSGAGSTYLIFGHRGTWSSPLALSSLNGITGVVINGIVANDRSGTSVASAGDVNGDGIDDVLIGAWQADPGGFSGAGSTYLIFGHTGAWSSPLALSSLNGIKGVVINGIAANALSGRSVASAGDVNGDGINDMLIGAYHASPGLLEAGSTYLIFGHTGAWSSPLALSSLNGIKGVVFNGIAANDQSGFSVASAGDVNGDGIDDVLIGTGYASSGNRSRAGSTYLIFGHTGAWSSPLALGSLNGTTGVVINGIAANDRSGNSVAGAGDVNGDGISDVLIGAPGAAPGGFSSAGSTYLILGHTGVWSSPLVLSSLDGANGFVINGIAVNDISGCSVASAGDVNGDGISDVLIGASQTSPGGLSYAGSTYLIFGDSLDFFINTLTIDKGQTIFLNNSMLAAYHPHNLATNVSISFSITNVLHGTFSIRNFVQSALSQQLVSFTHDGSIYPPSYEVRAGNFAIVGPKAALISFAVPPVLYVNPFSVGQGQTIVLSRQAIRATSLYYPPDALMFSVSNVLHGNFVKTNTTTTESQFNQSVLTLGQIAFATDGSANVPSYDISVSNGRITAPVIRGTVNFNAAPILLNNQLTLTTLQQKVILSSNELSASDTATPLGELIFTPSTYNCHFENLNLPGTALPSFLQGNIQSSQILFFWDGYNAPAYNMSVSDGTLSAGYPASITLTPVPNASSISTESTNTGAIVGGVVAAGAIGLFFFGLQRYLKKKTNAQFQKILLEETSDAEKAFNRDVVRPIANKIFNVINTTGFWGQRSEADTKAYMMAIGKIVSELRRQNANLNFNAMEAIDKESFLNEIASQTCQQSLPQHKGYSCERCTRYFKAEATPQEIEYAAEGIALAAIAWQSRHANAARGRRLTLELETHNNVGFSDESENESLPPEKQFKFMQNHIKVIEQQRQQEQEERKQLEERFALQEAELASFRQESAIRRAS